MRSWAAVVVDTAIQDSEDLPAPNSLARVSDHEPVPPPPPPPSSVPPPPTGAPGEFVSEAAPSRDVRKDNPIAVASIVVATLALVLAMVVIGGFVGLIAIGMAIVGIRRSKTTGRGKGLSISAMVIAVFSVVVSVVAFIIIGTIIQGEDTVVNGITSSSSNTEFPPQEDVIDVVCTEDGGLPLAEITIENMSPEASAYTLTITWETEAGGELVEILRSTDLLPTGEQDEFRLFQRGTGAIAESCAVDRIERTSLAFLTS